MKNIILALSLFCASFSFAQEFSVDYKIQYTYTHHSNLNALESSKSESLYLFTGENQSIFMNYNDAHEKEIQKKAQEMQRVSGYIDMDKIGRRASSFQSQYYKNPTLQEVWILQRFASDFYAYPENRMPLEWTILDQEEEEYMAYKVQAATADFAGRSYTAWFTTEIPIPDGPHVFHGLPGLIVDVYDTDKHFRFQLEGIEKPEEETIWKILDTKKIEQAEFIKIKKNHEHQEEQMILDMINDGTAEFENESGGTMTAEEYLYHKRKKDKALKSKLNPMELE